MSADEHTDHIHVTPLWIYLAVAGALLFLTAITVAVAHVDLNAFTGISWLNILVAMIIATVKASLVALIFMHLLFDNRLNLVVMGVSVVTLGIFIVLTMLDTEGRGSIDPETSGQIRPAIIYHEDGTLKNPKVLDEHHDGDH